MHTRSACNVSLTKLQPIKTIGYQPRNRRQKEEPQKSEHTYTGSSTFPTEEPMQFLKKACPTVNCPGTVG